MCLLCKKEQEFLSEDEARALSKARHTMPWFKPGAEPPDILLDPEGWRRFQDKSAMYDNTPDPPRHPSLSAIRQHRRKGETEFWKETAEEYCAPCAGLYNRPDFLDIWRRDALERVEARLSPSSGVYEDPELRAYYERKRERLLKRLSGEKTPPRRKFDEPTVITNARLPQSLRDRLEERAAEDDVTVSDLIRRALDEWLLL